MNWEQQRQSFGANAAGYDSRRPDWPAATAAWLTGAEPGSGREGTALDVVDLGAGTGKLTSTLAELGHRVTAVEPDPGMLDVLSRKLPQVTAVRAAAERIPLPDGSADVVTVAQAWHWMEQPAAALEIARVLRPGGLLAVAWHKRDLDTPWVAELNELAGVPDWAAEQNTHSGHTVVELPPAYAPTEYATFGYTLTLPPTALVDLVASWSYVATRPDRDEVLERVRALGERVAADQGSPAALGLPHVTQCHRARTLAD
ncbi:methyltransferase domain-containing protein [Kineosporia sp. J2-2]|uniref:Methyltransferase domain-containing protein n=1 Tax=Kineosporia corallincola TaxID=2835133 RepID=A0ABS5TNN8_9ACTN|nr:class I SAM-dependent methyltransferase [Kineosporia corallincola]MBT0772707.1 methyltransferase domain-containing protein [Kineosporia corallincola]